MCLCIAHDGHSNQVVFPMVLVRPFTNPLVGSPDSKDLDRLTCADIASAPRKSRGITGSWWRLVMRTGHEDWGKTLGAGDWSQVQLENSWGGRDGSCLVEILATDINCYHLKRNLWLCTWRLDVLNNGENQDMSFPYVREFHKCRLGWYRVFLPLGATPSYHPLKKMDFPSRLDHDDGNSHSFSAFLGPSGASAAFVGGFPAITTSQLTGWQPVHQPMWQEIRFYIGWVP